MQPKTVSILGSGNVATILGLRFKQAGYQVLEVYSRTLENAKALANLVQAKSYTSDLSSLNEESVLYVIAVSDDAISWVVESMPKLSGVVVHTSGVQNADMLKEKFENWGIFYPLQTFTKEKEVDFTNLPFLLTTEKTGVLDFLQQVVSDLGALSYEVKDTDKAHIHVAAVMVNNFTNHLFSLAEDYLQSQEVAPEVLRALIQETFDKYQSIGSQKAQTGPAIRRDELTINKHLDLLGSTNDTTLVSLYKIFTDSIKDYYQK